MINKYMNYTKINTDIIEFEFDNYILCIDDNPIVLRFFDSIINRSLNDNTIKVNKCDSISKAKSLCVKNEYSLIFCDNTLELNIEDSISILRNLQKNSTIIITALSDINLCQEYIMGLGADGVIYKPIDINDIFDILIEIFDIKKEDLCKSSSFQKALTKKIFKNSK